MLAIVRSNLLRGGLAVAAIAILGLSAHAQPSAIDNELKRLNGHWRVVEMVEDGRAIPEDQLRQWLPGGGIFEIVDYTIIFKSPVNGAKSTKSFRLDPASYPKQMAIIDRDSTTGTGIYKFDQGKLILCITNEAAQVPTEFSASAGSKRTLLILERFDPGSGDIPGMNMNLPPHRPMAVTTAQLEPQPQPQQQIPSVPLPEPPQVVARPSSIPYQQPQQQTTPPPSIVADNMAGRVLTDTEVRDLAIGTWRLNDSEGSVDIVFGIDGTFKTYRYYKTMSNFQYVFTPTPISAGRWSISSGRLIANVTSSSRADRVNQSFVPAVRSISPTDMILEDHLGRVMRAVKIR
ncbi:TIGR03067 domain-containing protein [Stieleria sp. TO1_6]|uniref:TIGR03067 domain-containing protein n=1 Tax=Stieleria tagensis TaxID=2956795 RepID=UPI00209A807C|nr:TIGR03067 domain-containing protein [Stieleria tagensis]MCO8122822.1 TIGR03067 domain-containing protein [Stieleria tagensis]